MSNVTRAIHNAHLKSPIRRYRMKPHTHLELPTSFVEIKPDGSQQRVSFRSQSNADMREDENGLVIEGFLEFNHSNPVDRYNWGILKRMLSQEGCTFSDMITLDDPEEKNKEVVKNEELRLSAMQRVSSLKEDTDKLKTLYRRIFGTRRKAGSHSAYPELLKHASEFPMEFFVNDTFITEDSDFSGLSKIDEYVEFRVLTMDGDGTIRYADSGKKLAKNASDAWFVISKDSDEKKYLDSMLSQKKSESESGEYVPTESPGMFKFGDLSAKGGSDEPDNTGKDRLSASEVFEKAIEYIFVTEEDGEHMYSVTNSSEKLTKGEFIDMLDSNEVLMNKYIDLVKEVD